MDAHDEIHADAQLSKLNWLRAAVLGANDGIVSVAALVVGVAGATSEGGTIFITGIAGLMSGALSMAVGEYVSVSSQRDVEEGLLAKERKELAEQPEAELEELTGLYQAKGVSRETAEVVARELTAHDAFAAHVDVELKIDPEDLTSPWQAAWASGVSFTIGALLPLLAITLPPASIRIPVTFASVIVALAITGYLSARSSEAPVGKVLLRVVFGGFLAMLVTFGIGWVFGVAVA